MKDNKLFLIAPPVSVGDCWCDPRRDHLFFWWGVLGVRSGLLVARSPRKNEEKTQDKEVLVTV